MRKKLTLFAVFLLSFCVFFAPKIAAAQTFPSKIEDNVQLFGGTSNQLATQAQALAQETKAGVFIVTTESSEAVNQFSKSYLANQVGAGNNGVVLTINMSLRKVYIWSTGNLQYYLPSNRINAILDIIQPELTANNATGAATDFLSEVSRYYQAGIPTSRHYTVDETTGVVTFHRSFIPLNLLIAFIIALIIAGVFVWTIYRRYQMKDAHAVWRYDFHSNGQLDLTENTDILINTFVTSRRIPRPSSNGGGTGGMSGGSGGGRSF